MILPGEVEVQIPLIHIVESDDLYLEAQENVFWFDLLRDLDWRWLRPVAARCYEALWQFNEQQARARAERWATAAAANPETAEEATCRLLFERPTLCEDAVIVHEPEPPEPSAIRVDPATLRPGQTPGAMGGLPAPRVPWAACPPLYAHLSSVGWQGRASRPWHPAWHEGIPSPAG